MKTEHSQSNFPKLHATVGYLNPNGDPPIDFETFLDRTTEAEIEGLRFDGIDLALHDSYLPLDVSDSQIKALAKNLRERELTVGSIAAPTAKNQPGSEQWRDCIRDSCRIGRRLRSLGRRPSGVIQIDSSPDLSMWDADPFAAQQEAIRNLHSACDIAEEFGERVAISRCLKDPPEQDWNSVRDLLQRVNRKHTLGFQADLAEAMRQALMKVENGGGQELTSGERHDTELTSSHLMNATMRALADVLRPWTVTLHLGQMEDPIVGNYILPSDEAGLIQFTHHAGAWLHGADGQLTRTLRQLNWDASPFPAAVLVKQATWDAALEMMVSVRDAHGWKESAKGVPVRTRPKKKQVRKSSPTRRATPKKKERTRASTDARKPRKPAAARAAKRSGSKKGAPGKNGKPAVKKKTARTGKSRPTRSK